MEENMELVQVKEDLANMTDEERDMLQKIIASMIVGVLHSVSKDMAIENVKKELEVIVGEEVTDEDLTETFGENAVSEIVDMFTSMTTDNVANVMTQIGLNTFADVGYLLDKNMNQEKLTCEE